MIELSSGRTTTTSAMQSNMRQSGLSKGSKRNTMITNPHALHHSGSDDFDDLQMEFLTDEKIGQPQPVSAPPV
jgi:hypothetical protein